MDDRCSIVFLSSIPLKIAIGEARGLLEVRLPSKLPPHIHNAGGSNQIPVATYFNTCWIEPDQNILLRPGTVVFLYDVFAARTPACG